MNFSNVNIKSENISYDQEPWIVREIQTMMHGFGDCNTPLLATAQLIEEVMMKQLRSAVCQAAEIATLRRAALIRPEDFIFLMRKDICKINRMLKYLELKDAKFQDFTKVHGTLTNGDSDLSDAISNHLESGSVRRNNCVKFLMSISNKELLRKSNVDLVKQERLVRADSIASSLDSTKYAEYSKARRASFTNFNSKVASLQDEVMKPLKDIPDMPRLTSSTSDILGYIAFETVAQIVDMALLVRQDMAAQISDPLSRFASASFIHPQQTSAGLAVGAPPPISPAEVREALRRYWSPQFSQFNSSSHLKKRLLAF